MIYNRMMICSAREIARKLKTGLIIVAAVLASGCDDGFGTPDVGKLVPIGPMPDPDPVADSQTLAITDENDDGEVFAGYPPGSQLLFDGESDASDLYVGNNGVTPLYGFFRFQLTKAIPAGAVVSSALIDLYGDGDYQWDDISDSLLITANDSANIPRMAIFEDTIGGTTGNMPTNAVVPWPASGPLVWNRAGLNQTPNLKAIVQELVDKHGGLAAGVSIQFWMFGLPAIGDSEIRVADFGHPQHATALKIDWAK